MSLLCCGDLDKGKMLPTHQSMPGPDGRVGPVFIRMGKAPPPLPASTLRKAGPAPH